VRGQEARWIAARPGLPPAKITSAPRYGRHCLDREARDRSRAVIATQAPVRVDPSDSGQTQTPPYGPVPRGM